MEPHSIQEFHVLDGVAPVVVAIIFIVGSSLIKEPNRRNFMAIMIAGAGAAYLSGGALGKWEFAFTYALRCGAHLRRFANQCRSRPVVCPGLGLRIRPGPHTQVCPYHACN
jgi:Family of unknown function (DUF6010)